MSEEKKSSLDLLVDNGIFVTTNNKDEKTKIIEKIISFIEIVKADTTFVNVENNEFDLFVALKIKIAELQEKLNKQIDNVIHHEKFTSLEGKWRGLDHLIRNVEHGESMKIKVLSVGDDYLAKDLLKASDFDQSKLFKKVYENEIGTLGGTPFSVMLYDFYFNASNYHVEFMEKLTLVCAAAHCPCISSVAPTVFNIEDFRKINQSRDIAKVFQTNARIAWNSFRMKEDSRYMTIVLPRIMARAPYSIDNNPAEGIAYHETVDSNFQGHFIWMNTVYALAVRIATAQSNYGWTAAIRGIEGGGCAYDLPIFLYTKKEGDLGLKCPTEVSITDRREKELSDLGFAPLCHSKGTNLAVFFSVQTLQVPQLYDKPNANANARMSASMPYMLIASRFAHYIKVMIRNKIGSFQSAASIENYLQNWVSSYVLLNPTASQDLKSQMPLKNAKVNVIETPGTVGVYDAIIWVSPHLQLDEMSVSIRLVSRLPQIKS